MVHKYITENRWFCSLSLPADAFVTCYSLLDAYVTCYSLLRLLLLLLLGGASSHTIPK